ncbi:hypothetical protein X975_11475, partial [Stegodyphus mimosarum]
MEECRNDFPGAAGSARRVISCEPAAKNFHRYVELKRSRPQLVQEYWQEFFGGSRIRNLHLGKFSKFAVEGIPSYCLRQRMIAAQANSVSTWKSGAACSNKKRGPENKLSRGQDEQNSRRKNRSPGGESKSPRRKRKRKIQELLRIFSQLFDEKPDFCQIVTHSIDTEASLSNSRPETNYLGKSHRNMAANIYEKKKIRRGKIHSFSRNQENHEKIERFRGKIRILQGKEEARVPEHSADEKTRAVQRRRNEKNVRAGSKYRPPEKTENPDARED